MTEEKSITIDASEKKAKPIEGKTKIVQRIEEEIAEVTTKNTLTAYDALKEAEIPVAEMKTTQTCNVFEMLKKCGIDVAFLKRTGPNTFLTKFCFMLPIEFVVRSRPFGSYLKRNPYANVQEPFDKPVVEFFHKLSLVGPVTHHVNLDMIYDGYRIMAESRAREFFMQDGQWTAEVYTDPYILSKNNELHFFNPKAPIDENKPLLVLPNTLRDDNFDSIVSELVLPTFNILQKAWSKYNVELVDLKVEIGIDAQNPEKFYIADVIDNDSWRIWLDGDPTKQLDKQNFRDGKDLEHVLSAYQLVTEYTNTMHCESCPEKKTIKFVSANETQT